MDYWRDGVFQQKQQTLPGCDQRSDGVDDW
jgi:hypothetical protein